MIKKIEIIGPCALESLDQIAQVAKLANSHGITYIRAGLFKPRTEASSFQGLGIEGLNILTSIKTQYPKLKFVSEVCSAEQFDLIKNHVHGIQIGARNMQNFELLKHISKNFNHDFVILKRGFGNTFEEWMKSTSYLKTHINMNKIVLCERGIRTLYSPTHTTIDFVSALEARHRGYQVIIDPSHGSKDRKYVGDLLKASLALGFGYIVECHPEPEKSVSDAQQALSLSEISSYL